jgi:RHS repeat-associated protein
MHLQNGSVHQYLFDGLGRRTSDQVTTLGANVDGTVQRVDTAYEIRGMVNLITSYANTTGSSIVNQVTLAYDPFGQLLSDQQNQSGLSGPNLTVNYAYAAITATSNTVRRTTVQYPYNTGSRSVTLNYNSGDDTALSRVSSLSFTGVTVTSWSYFGLGSVAETQYDSGAINSQLANGALYPGLDLFGRVVNLPWTQSTTGDLAQFNYGYDQASNRTYRQDVKAESASASFDELYSYDGLHRLATTARGTLSSGDANITSPTLQQSWQLDATGNWSGFSNFDLVTASNTLVQQRASNPANEITAISATVGSAWQTPAYDRNGNMTAIPEPLSPTSAFTGVWDAWNRLIALKSGTNYVESNVYDGLNRRVMRDIYSSGTLSESRFFIYSDQWQVLEEYLSTSLTMPVVQWVWGARYIDDCVLRDRSNSGTLNERLYALQDANWNVVALYNPSTSAVVERYAYTPYGVPLFLNTSFTPLSGNVSGYAWETLYCGYRYDATVGVYVVRNRWFNPPLGCWMRKDPLGLWPDQNPYRYVRSSPTSRIDPTGEVFTKGPGTDLKGIGTVVADHNDLPVGTYVGAGWFGSAGWLNMVPTGWVQNRCNSHCLDANCRGSSATKSSSAPFVIDVLEGPKETGIWAAATSPTTHGLLLFEQDFTVVTVTLSDVYDLYLINVQKWWCHCTCCQNGIYGLAVSLSYAEYSTKAGPFALSVPKEIWKQEIPGKVGINLKEAVEEVKKLAGSE